MALRFWRGVGAVPTAWNATDNWSATSGGSTGASVPTAADDVTLDAAANSNNPCNTNVAGTCLTFTVATGAGGYTATFTMTSNLTVAGNVTLGSHMGTAGTGILICNANSTLRSNGKTWSAAMQLNAFTFTLFDDWTVSSPLTTGGIPVINSNILKLGGNFTLSNAISGTATIELNGTVTWSGASIVSNNLTITGGTITISGTVAYGTNTLTYTAGTVTAGGSTLQIASTCTLNTSGMSWNIIDFNIGSTSITITLSSNLTATSHFTTILSSGVLTINGSSFFIGGNLTANSMTVGTIAGTTNLVMNGTGAISMTAVTTGAITANLNFNTVSGTITISGTFNYRTGTLKYTQGTVTTAGSNLVMSVATTLDTGGMSWNNITPTAAIYTINSLLEAGGTMALSGTGAYSFIGAAGFTVANLIITTTGTVTHSFLQGRTYTVTTLLQNLNSTNSLRVTLASSSATLATTFTLNTGATIECAYLNGTRMDSSGGRTVRVFSGTFSGTTNWGSFTDIIVTTTG